MNSRFYESLTRIVLAVSVILAIAGSVAFVLLEDYIKNMPFSDF